MIAWLHANVPAWLALTLMGALVGFLIWALTRYGS